MNMHVIGGTEYDHLYILPDAKHSWILCCWLDVHKLDWNNLFVFDWLILFAVKELLRIYITQGLKGVNWNKETEI